MLTKYECNLLNCFYSEIFVAKHSHTLIQIQLEICRPELESTALELRRNKTANFEYNKNQKITCCSKKGENTPKDLPAQTATHAPLSFT